MSNCQNEKLRKAIVDGGGASLFPAHPPECFRHGYGRECPEGICQRIVGVAAGATELHGILRPLHEKPEQYRSCGCTESETHPHTYGFHSPTVENHSPGQSSEHQKMHHFVSTLEKPDVGSKRLRHKSQIANHRNDSHRRLPLRNCRKSKLTRLHSEAVNSGATAAA